MKSTINETQQSVELTYPCLMRCKDAKFVVLAISDTKGTVVSGENWQGPIGHYSEGWCSFRDKEVWGLLPAGTTVTLSND